MYLRTNNKRNTILLLLYVLTVAQPPTVSSLSFKPSGSSPANKLKPPELPSPKIVGSLLREWTTSPKKNLLRIPFISNDNNGDDEDGGTGNTKKVMRELGIDYDPMTTPRLGIVGLNQVWDVAYTSLLFLLRSGSGTFASGYTLSLIPRDASLYTPFSIGPYQLLESSSSPSPSSPATTKTTKTKIQIYDQSPSTRQSYPIHELISRLGLEVTYHPCPVGGTTRRMLLDSKNYGEGTNFPILMDGENGVELFGGGDITDYIVRFWGGGRVGGVGGTARPLALGPLPLISGSAVTRRKPSNPPPNPLILYTFEGCPYSRSVREELYALEIVYRQVSCPRGSVNRQRLFEKTMKNVDGTEGEGGGRFQVPYLEDPNTGVGLFESGVIVEYLRGRYGVGESPVRYL